MTVRFSRTPVIALTANAMAHQLAEYREAGLDAVVTKPVQRAELMTELEAAVGRRKKKAA